MWRKPRKWLLYKADVKCRFPTKALSCALDAYPLAKRETRTIGAENKNVFGMAPFACWVEKIGKGSTKSGE